MEKLAGIYMDGLYVAKDIDLVLFWLQKAAENGSEDAPDLIAAIRKDPDADVLSFEREVRAAPGVSPNRPVPH